MTYQLLDAYFCRNLGDDLMIAELCTARPNEVFVAPDLLEGMGESLRSLGNLSCGPRRWFRHGVRANGYVICGGSMFIDREQGLRSRLRFVRRWSRRVGVALIMRLLGRPVEVVGCNIGPVETAWGRYTFSAFLRLSTRLTVRDEPSEDIARRWGIDHVQRAPDMVLSYLRANRPVISRSENKRGSTSVYGISVMELPGLGFDASVREYAAIVRAILKADPSAHVRLFGFQDRVVRDDVVVKEIGARLDGEVRVTSCCYNGSVEEVLASFEECTRILAVRFHSGILALGLGIPMVQIAYSEKIGNYLRGVGWDGAIRELRPGLLRGGLVDALLAAEPVVHRPISASVHAQRDVR